LADHPEEPTANEEAPTRYASRYAPAGGIIVGKTAYKGGMRIPSNKFLEASQRFWSKVPTKKKKREADLDFAAGSSKMARGGRPVQKSLGESHVTTMLKSLNGDDRRGALHPEADYVKRGALADALQLEGRDDEAELAKGPHPIGPTPEGKLLPQYGAHLTDGYPPVFVDKLGRHFCEDCANEYATLAPSSEQLRPDVIWEGPPGECHQCGEEIPTAYGDPHHGEE
jgi:hypothetical protein